ncbi:MAG: MotA/TolQ/ExbB proton channel family protein, partial [Desulfobulbaceae bacterium]|nr:MotA/TolQ/ExbB proton channel family protein [Desulfobulbaceae bacterium]
MSISIVDMMWHAGPMVQFVMITLLIFSVGSWSIIIMKHLLFKKVRRNSEDFLDHFWQSKTLNEAYDSAREFTQSPEAAVFVSGFHELKKISAAREQKEGEGETLEMQLATLDNMKRSMRKAEIMELQRLGRWLPFLATTGSAAPFIGLFGTVWGI